MDPIVVDGMRVEYNPRTVEDGPDIHLLYKFFSGPLSTLGLDLNYACRIFRNFACCFFRKSRPYDYLQIRPAAAVFPSYWSLQVKIQYLYVQAGKEPPFQHHPVHGDKSLKRLPPHA